MGKGTFKLDSLQCSIVTQINKDVKDFVMKSFSCNDGIVRVIFATIAFGMGVDCKGLTTVINTPTYFPNLLLYFTFNQL